MAVRLLANMVNVGRAFWAWGSLWLPQPRIELLSLVPADLLHLPTTCPSFSIFQLFWSTSDHSCFKDLLPSTWKADSFPFLPWWSLYSSKPSSQWLPLNTLSWPAWITILYEHLVNRNSNNGRCLRIMFSVLYIYCLSVHTHLKKEGFLSLFPRLEEGGLRGVGGRLG